jgi:aspartate carbamoyltransferase catalytic subunit
LKVRTLISIDDLSDDEVDLILDRAVALKGGASPVTGLGAVAGLVFFEPSLRTRVGFAAAAARLGMHPIEVVERRSPQGRQADDIRDALRVVAGYADVVIGRPSVDVDPGWLRRDLGRPYISAGGVGPAAEHPTQALIDLAAIVGIGRPVDQLQVCICGDGRMRAVRSLLKVLARWQPGGLTLAVPEAWRSEVDVPASLNGRTILAGPECLGSADVVYVAGMRHESIDLAERERYLIGPEVMSSLGPSAVVLSPMPVVDEIDPQVRGDSRVRIMSQSDHGLFIRQAILERVLTLDAG